MRVLDLFSGIGGFSLGLERAGMRTVAFCEIEPYARAVLAKHWPDVPCYDDVRTLTADRLNADGIVPDVICGGFPCQDISTAGNGSGLTGERSGLWAEYARLIGEIRPRFVIVENVAALLHRGLGEVLRDLAEIGYDAEWHCIPASAVGAPHRRDRIWIVVYPNGLRRMGGEFRPSGDSGPAQFRAWLRCSLMADADRLWKLQPQGRVKNFRRRFGDSSWWDAEPRLGRMAHGVPDGMDRLKGLGNAVVPQIPQIIGEAIMAANRA